MAKYLRVEMPDGSRWDIPAYVIAANRADHYADEFDGDIEKSLAEDTSPLFERSPGEIAEWAVSNMNWSDVAAFAVRADPPPPRPVDYEAGWMNGEKEVVER